jgi:hypothetical protein
MVLDAAGNLHIAGSRGRDIVYLTNAAGAWGIEVMPTPDGLERVDHAIATAVDASGRIAVAYERNDCPPAGCLGYSGAVRVAVFEPGETDVQAVELGDGLDPSIALHDGVVHVTWIAGEWTDDNFGCPRPGMYATNASGDWVTTKLIADASSGLALAIGTDGEPIVATTNPCYSLSAPGYLITLAPDGSPKREPIPAIEQGDMMVAVASDATGQTHLVFWDFDDQVRYAVGGVTGWSERTRILEGLGPRGLAADDSGVAHFIAVGRDFFAYASSSTDPIVSQTVTTQDVSPFYRDSAIVVDSIGTPHILFVSTDNDGEPAKLWYATAIH